MFVRVCPKGLPVAGLAAETAATIGSNSGAAYQCVQYANPAKFRVYGAALDKSRLSNRFHAVMLYAIKSK